MVASQVKVTLVFSKTGPGGDWVRIMSVRVEKYIHTFQQCLGGRFLISWISNPPIGLFCSRQKKKTVTGNLFIFVPTD